MENQIDIDNQNTQQIGQNPINQPSQIPEKPKINYWIVSSILLFIILVASTGWFVLKSKNKISSQQPSTNAQAQQTVVTGVIRTSGLSDKEKQKFGLASANYQVTNFGDYQKAYKESQIMGYFLLSNNVSDDLLGKCVRVTGTIPEDWKNKNKANVYYRLVLNVANIEEVHNSNCNPYAQTQPAVDNTVEKLTLRGTVIHARRPAPDIGYDYQIKLSEPFVDKFSSTSSPQKVSLVYVNPTTNNLWNELENNIDKEITVDGYMVWGYAKSRYFQLTNVKRGDVSEEAEIKNLVTKFEKYIQDRNVQGLMSLYTPPKTSDEISSYRNLMGQDPNVGTPRLFNNVSSNFIVTSWKVASRESPDNKELITKDGNKYIVTVEETRKSWCNADPCTGTYSFENTTYYVFEIVKQTSSWMIDKYYPQPASPKTVVTKYEGLNF